MRAVPLEKGGFELGLVMPKANATHFILGFFCHFVWNAFQPGIGGQS